MEVSPQQVVAGQAVYTRRNLNSYDLVVHGVSNPLIWKCPTPRLVDLYERHVSANHLDVGVGTGLPLDRCAFPSATPRVALMDLNPNTLMHASRRISRYRPEIWQRNVLEPIAFDAPHFDSIGISYLLHCLPGSMTSKAVVFDHLAALLNPGGVVFGATLLQGGVARNWLARRLMALYNRKGIFSNRHDSLDALSAALHQRFATVELQVVGCAALFSAQHPR